VLFLPCLDRMAGQLLDGRPGLRAGTTWDRPAWEARRGIKEWLSSQFMGQRSYKPTVDQLAMTRFLDLQRLRKAGVPCFGTLERAVRFLATAGDGHAGAVYPSCGEP